VKTDRIAFNTTNELNSGRRDIFRSSFSSDEFVSFIDRMSSRSVQIFPKFTVVESIIKTGAIVVVLIFEQININKCSGIHKSAANCDEELEEWKLNRQRCDVSS
jgi:hypothetical protein